MVEREAGFDLDALRAIVAADAGSADFPALAEAERRAGHPDRARSVAEAGLAAAPGRMAGRVAFGLALLDLGRIEEARTALSVILDATLAPHRIATHTPSVPLFTQAAEHPLAADAVGGPQIPWPAEVGSAEEIPVWARESAAAGGSALSSDLNRLALGSGARAGIDDDELEMAFAVAEPQIDEMISPNHMAERVLLDHASLDDPLDDPLDDSFDFETDDDDSPLLELDEEEDGIGAPGPAFRTATMAELLAKQGDTAGAEAIRRELDRGSESVRSVDAAVAPGRSRFGLDIDAPEEGGGRSPGRAAKILATLERWLHNVQRGRA